MAEDSAQEKTEEPTARKLSKAREDGQVARSIELPAAAIVIGAFLMLLATGGWLVTRIAANFANGFVFDRKTLDQPLLLPTAFFDQILDGFLLITPILLVTAVLAVVAAGMTGGYLFSLKAVAPKGSKLSLIAGFKRMFGTHAATELGKAVLKFTLVSGVLWLSIASEFDTLLQLGRMGLEPALTVGGELIAKSALWISLSLAVIAFIDVPIQKSQFTKRMRMTQQEVKDEMKDIEGRPEVKAQIRRRQREMANGRMMQRVKDADVIITNPEHFAVALEYDPSSDRPPVVVAKGMDEMAARIREEGGVHGVHIFSAPPLARALYFTTEVEAPINEALYHAVAQVIAYVYNLEAAQPGRGGVVKPQPKVPANMRYDADGRVQTDPA
jgi:flagellar biosynthetic protein FlhB